MWRDNEAQLQLWRCDIQGLRVLSHRQGVGTREVTREGTRERMREVGQDRLGQEETKSNEIQQTLPQVQHPTQG